MSFLTTLNRAVRAFSTPVAVATKPASKSAPKEPKAQFVRARDAIAQAHTPQEIHAAMVLANARDMKGSTVAFYASKNPAMIKALVAMDFCWTEGGKTYRIAEYDAVPNSRRVARKVRKAAKQA